MKRNPYVTVRRIWENVSMALLIMLVVFVFVVLPVILMWPTAGAFALLAAPVVVFVCILYGWIADGLHNAGRSISGWWINREFAWDKEH